jgi:hypothetical protein
MIINSERELEMLNVEQRGYVFSVERRLRKVKVIVEDVWI